MPATYNVPTVPTSSVPALLASARGVAVGTSATTVVSPTAPATSTYLVGGYVNVTTATTVVTVQVQWTDPATGSTETFTWYSAAPLAVGIYPLAAVPVVAQAGAAITVSATAGTANQVTAAAVITQLA